MYEFLFILAIIVLTSTYLVYPVLLFVLSLFVKKQRLRKTTVSDISMIIPVHNEAKSIIRKIDNCNAIEYPRDKLHILFSSDASTDATDQIIKDHSSSGFELVTMPERKGKVAAQNAAVTRSSSEVVIFTDSAISVKPDSVSSIIENFADESVGAVSCRDYMLEGSSDYDGEESYIAYDMWLRRLNSRISTLIGVTGGFFAVRRELLDEPWDPAFPPDFYAALVCIRKGLRVVEDDRVGAYYTSVASKTDEFIRKVRTYNRGITALFSNIDLLNPLRYGFASVALFFQKLMRWLMPLPLLLLLCCNYHLAGTSLFYDVTWFGQLVLYGAGIVGYVLNKWFDKSTWFNYPYYFLLTNVALIRAWVEWMFGKRYIKWQPTKR